MVDGERRRRFAFRGIRHGAASTVPTVLGIPTRDTNGGIMSKPVSAWRRLLAALRRHRPEQPPDEPPPAPADAAGIELLIGTAVVKPRRPSPRPKWRPIRPRRPA